MTDFDIRGVATIKAVRPRKEGPSEARYTVLDVKLTTQTNGENLERIMGVNWEALRGALWDADEEANPRFWAITEIRLGERELSNITLVVGGEGGLMVRDCDVRKIAFLPKPNHVAEMTCTIGIPEPSDLAYTVCGENLGEEVEVRLQAAQQELGLEEAR